MPTGQSYRNSASGDAPLGAGPRTDSSLNSFSALTQFSIILPVFAAALKIQFMNSVSGGFVRPIMATSLIVSTGAGVGPHT